MALAPEQLFCYQLFIAQIDTIVRLLRTVVENNMSAWCWLLSDVSPRQQREQSLDHTAALTHTPVFFFPSIAQSPTLHTAFLSRRSFFFDFVPFPSSVPLISTVLLGGVEEAWAVRNPTPSLWKCTGKASRASQFVKD